MDRVASGVSAGPPPSGGGGVGGVLSAALDELDESTLRHLRRAQGSIQQSTTETARHMEKYRRRPRASVLAPTTPARGPSISAPGTAGAGACRPGVDAGAAAVPIVSVPALPGATVGSPADAAGPAGPSQTASRRRRVSLPGCGLARCSRPSPFPPCTPNLSPAYLSSSSEVLAGVLTLQRRAADLEAQCRAASQNEDPRSALDWTGLQDKVGGLISALDVATRAVRAAAGRVDPPPPGAAHDRDRVIAALSDGGGGPSLPSTHVLVFPSRLEKATASFLPQLASAALPPDHVASDAARAAEARAAAVGGAAVSDGDNGDGGDGDGIGSAVYGRVVGGVESLRALAQELLGPGGELAPRQARAKPGAGRRDDGAATARAPQEATALARVLGYRLPHERAAAGAGIRDLEAQRALAWQMSNAGWHERGAGDIDEGVLVFGL